MKRSRILVAGCALALTLAGLPTAAQARGGCGPTWVGSTDSYRPSISADGRFVIFQAELPTPAGSTGPSFRHDVVLRDVVRRKTIRVSNPPEPYGTVTDQAISSDGRRIVYAVRPDRFYNDTELRVYDTRSRRTTSEGPVGVNTELSLSRSGRLVAFEQRENPGQADLLVRDVVSDRVTPVSVTPSGKPANGSSVGESISPDGRYVAFLSYASNLVPEDTDTQGDVLLRDLKTGRTRLLTPGTYPGGQGGGAPQISPDGRYVLTFEYDGVYRYDIRTRHRVRVYHSSTELPAGWNTSYGARHLLIRVKVPGSPGSGLAVLDLRTGKRQIVTVPVPGRRFDGEAYGPKLSPDARYVAFYSISADLVPADTNGLVDVFVRDLRTGRTVLASRPTDRCSTGPQTRSDGKVSAAAPGDHRRQQ
jgi:Tol biopolymer transport system component